jgi:hypothetical protein
MQQETLKECPHCGTAEIKSGTRDGRPYVDCKTCHSTVYFYRTGGNSEITLADLWNNRRAPVAATVLPSGMEEPAPIFTASSGWVYNKADGDWLLSTIRALQGQLATDEGAVRIMGKQIQGFIVERDAKDAEITRLRAALKEADWPHAMLAAVDIDEAREKFEHADAELSRLRTDLAERDKGTVAGIPVPDSLSLTVMSNEILRLRTENEGLREVTEYELTYETNLDGRGRPAAWNKRTAEWGDKVEAAKQMLGITSMPSYEYKTAANFRNVVLKKRTWKTTAVAESVVAIDAALAGEAPREDAGKGKG